MNMTRARCLLQAEKKPRCSICNKEECSLPREQGFKWLPGLPQHGQRDASLRLQALHAELKSQAPPRKPVITCSLSLFFGSALNAFSILCCFSASLLSFIYHTFVDLLRILPYPLFFNLHYLLMYCFCREQSLYVFYSSTHQSYIL